MSVADLEATGLDDPIDSALVKELQELVSRRTARPNALIEQIEVTLFAEAAPLQTALSDADHVLRDVTNVVAPDLPPQEAVSRTVVTSSDPVALGDAPDERVEGRCALDEPHVERDDVGRLALLLGAGCTSFQRHLVVEEVQATLPPVGAVLTAEQELDHLRVVVDDERQEVLPERRASVGSPRPLVAVHQEDCRHVEEEREELLRGTEGPRPVAALRRELVPGEVPHPQHVGVGLTVEHGAVERERGDRSGEQADAVRDRPEVGLTNVEVALQAGRVGRALRAELIDQEQVTLLGDHPLARRAGHRVVPHAEQVNAMPFECVQAADVCLLFDRHELVDRRDWLEDELDLVYAEISHCIVVVELDADRPKGLTLHLRLRDVVCTRQLGNQLHGTVPLPGSAHVDGWYFLLNPHAQHILVAGEHHPGRQHVEDVPPHSLSVRLHVSLSPRAPQVRIVLRAQPVSCSKM